MLSKKKGGIGIEIVKLKLSQVLFKNLKYSQIKTIYEIRDEK